MPDLNVTFGLSTLMNGVVQVAILLVIAIILHILAGWLIPKSVKTRIPKVHEESKEQLALRSVTLSKILVQIVRVFMALRQ